MRCFKNIFILLLCSVTTFCFAQKEDRNWVFGDSIRIDFNNLSSPTVHHANCFNNETNASISDNSGNLLMYSSIKDFWNGGIYSAIMNSQNVIMENGDSIRNNFSASNGAVFLPMLGTSKYYFFSLVSGQFPDCLNESIIDMSYNAGLGKVISKNIFLADSLSEQLLSVKHANGRDWWVIAKKFKTNQYVKFLLTPNGILGPFTQNIGSIFYSGIGECVASKDGSKLCFINWWGNRDVFNFDRCTGEFSNWIELGVPPYNQPPGGYWFSYACEFSEDGNRIYISSYDTISSKIEQYTLNNGNPINTKTDIIPPTIGVQVFQMQRAPNDKIYFVYGLYNGFFDSTFGYLSTINSPNDSATFCQLSLYSFYLNGYHAINGLPNIPNYNLSELVGSGCDTLNLSIQSENLKAKNSASIYPNPTTNELTIEILNGIAPKQIEITNSLGVTVMQLRQTKPNQQLNIRQLVAGVYFVKVKMQDGSVTVKRFVKSPT